MSLKRCIAVLAACALLTPAASSLASRKGGAATRVHEFVAFRAGKLAPRLKVKGRASGACRVRSLVVGRRTALAWRCSTGHLIRDPCFSATSSSKSVVCPRYPWRNDVLLVRLNSRLPREKFLEHAKNDPWGIWTANGKRCISYAGSALDTMKGKSVTYGCVGGGILLGYANTERRRWTISYAPRNAGAGPEGRRVETPVVGIIDVWR